MTAIAEHLQLEGMTKGQSFRKTPLTSCVKTIAGKVPGGRRRFATGTAALLAVGVGYYIAFGHNGLTIYQQKRGTSYTLDQQLDMLRRENGRLKEHVDRLQSDPDAIERQAREELHYTRPGEVIYTLPIEPATPLR